MKRKVLISAPYMMGAIERFKDLFLRYEIELLIPKVQERLSERELLDVISDIDGVICGDDQFTEHVLSKAGRLKVISKWGTGIDSIDKLACEKYSVKLFNTPNAFTVPVSDSAIGYILCFARNLHLMTVDMMNGGWNKISGHSLSESVLGVIGAGNIGKTVIGKARALGMTILVNDIKELDAKLIDEYELKLASKDELLSSSDYVSLHCDLNPTSQHLINESAFRVMKESAVIINTARGAIIDETALIFALQSKRIRGAALDVFENEPLSIDSPLRSMVNVMLAPHNSNSSPSAWETVHRNTVKNLLNALGYEYE